MNTTETQSGSPVDPLVRPHSNAVLWATDEECPQCGGSLGLLWWMECCGLVMCDTCRDTHDEKKGYAVRPNEGLVFLCEVKNPRKAPVCVGLVGSERD